MKNKFFTLVLFLISAIVTCEDFQPLNKNDYFKIVYLNDSIQVENSKGSFVTSKNNVILDSHQFSVDRKKILIFEKGDNTFPYYKKLCLIDGSRGTYSFLMKNWLNAMSDTSMKYILCQKSLTDVLNLTVFDIEKKKFIIVKIPLKNSDIVEKYQYTISIYRSEDAMYDFLVDLNFDSYIAAEYGFCIKNMIFTEIFDETLNSQASYKPFKEPTDFQVGW